MFSNTFLSACLAPALNILREENEQAIVAQGTSIIQQLLQY